MSEAREISDEPLKSRVLPDGRVLAAWQYLLNVRVTIGPPGEMYYEDGWCYRQKADALRVVDTWDGMSEDGPPGWNKHPETRRWRPDGTKESEERQGEWRSASVKRGGAVGR